MSEKELYEFTGEDVRLDVFLAENLPSYSRNFVKELIKNGLVSVDGEVQKPSFILKTGSSVTIKWPQTDAKKSLPIKNFIIHEDDALLVINKPAGLIVHPVKAGWEENETVLFSSGETLVSMLAAHYPQLKNINRYGLVHRLDRETSGVMLVAKTEAAQNNILSQFQTRKVIKLYNSICIGEVADEEGIINVPIGRVAGGKIKASSVGRSAVTIYKRLQTKNGFSFMQLYPKTGRTNQLRVHMAWLGYPVLGDYVYGKQPAPRLMLHAREIEFTHPKLRKKTKYCAPLPKDFNDILKKHNFTVK